MDVFGCEFRSWEKPANDAIECVIVDHVEGVTHGKSDAGYGTASCGVCAAGGRHIPEGFSHGSLRKTNSICKVHHDNSHTSRVVHDLH